MNNVYIMSKDIRGYTKERFFSDKDFYSVDELIGIIEDLEDELLKTKSEYDDFKNYVKDNYKPLSQAELIGWNENW